MISTISNIQEMESLLDERYISNQKTKELGKDDFLRLLLTQLRYQDPLNPLDGVQFTAQLAQFSTLEQLFNINDGINQITSTQEDTKKMEALSVLNKYVEAEGDLISVDGENSAKGSFILEEPGVCEVYIYSDDGLIRRIDLGSLGEGKHEFEWDGRDSNGDTVSPGIYSFQINAKNQEGESINVDLRIKGKITGVSFEGDEPTLFVGDIPINLSQILEVSANENS